MLSKLIYYAPNRDAAIRGMRKALDEYVIEGVRHNACLVQEVLRNPAFQAGETPTSFLPTHYPKGFTGVVITPAEEEEFAVAAAAIDKYRRVYLQEPPITGAKCPNEAVMVRVGGMFSDLTFRVQLDGKVARVAKVTRDQKGATTISAERTIQLGDNLDYVPTSYVARLELDGSPRSIQVLTECTTGEYEMQMHGSEQKMLIQSLREYELSAFMHVPLKADTSNKVLSPMPGHLISYAVKVGDEVQPGQELCIVEAMKMQNIVRSPRVGKIANLNIPVGASLKADQVIIELVPEESEADAKTTA